MITCGIRKASIEDLPLMQSVADEFYASSEFLSDFSMPRFCEIWGELISKDAGVIFVDVRDSHIAGVMGGIIHRDIYGEKLIAEEMFWFVKQDVRGGGIRLYKQFEVWAKGKGAASLHMMHLLDSMPAKVSDFYLRQGFKAVETRYSKNLA